MKGGEEEEETEWGKEEPVLRGETSCRRRCLGRCEGQNPGVSGKRSAQSGSISRADNGAGVMSKA